MRDIIEILDLAYGPLVGIWLIVALVHKYSSKTLWGAVLVIGLLVAAVNVLIGPHLNLLLILGVWLYALYRAVQDWDSEKRFDAYLPSWARNTASLKINPIDPAHKKPKGYHRPDVAEVRRTQEIPPSRY